MGINISKLGQEEYPELPLNKKKSSSVDGSMQRKKFASPAYRAATETFHIMEPLQNERRWEFYEG